MRSDYFSYTNKTHFYQLQDIYRALDLLDRERSISLKFETVKCEFH